MKRLLLGILALAALPVLHAQSLVGTWQGTLTAGPQKLRIVMKIAATPDDHLQTTIYSIDQPAPPFPANSTTKDGANVKVTVSQLALNFEGKMSADGKTIAGNWSQGGPMPLPLTLERATAETAWTIPEPPPPPRLMPADANPVFEVATIKPSKPEAQGIGLTINQSNLMNTMNTPLSFLMAFAYGVQSKQIVGGPSWLESERYDITAKADIPGQPNDRQLKAMLQKLLAERFELTFHREKRELSVYAITIAKAGAKLTESKNNPNSLPGLGFRGLGNLVVTNATIAEFAGLMQTTVVERPVIDQTGLGTKRYDFQLKWTPDASQFGGRGGSAPPPPDGVEAPPDLFTAIQQQIGLKMDATKAPVDVMVLDSVQKPSEN
ncbi:MAG TPA: TIGR03435 family protein [Bryobacteraceae bacterium]|jgi:uncharacterized protein (TIGR03435 family)